MHDNRYLKNRDMRYKSMGIGRRDGHYTRYKGYLERQDDIGYDHTMNKPMYNSAYSGDQRDYKPYDMRSDYNYDMRNDYGYDMTYDGHEKMSNEKYKKDLEHWAEKLKRKDRFKLRKEEIINHAKQMGVKFDEFEEDEFYVTYLMMVSDFKAVANDFRSYLNMAKEWLMDDDVEVSPSEKLCIYYYEIVRGEGTY